MTSHFVIVFVSLWPAEHFVVNCKTSSPFQDMHLSLKMGLRPLELTLVTIPGRGVNHHEAAKKINDYYWGNAAH